MHLPFFEEKAETQKVLHRGYIKAWDAQKGFGFIRRLDDIEKDIFVHHSDIEMADKFKVLKKNDIVTYEVVPFYSSNISQWSVCF